MTDNIDNVLIIAISLVIFYFWLLRKIIKQAKAVKKKGKKSNLNQLNKLPSWILLLASYLVIYYGTGLAYLEYLKEHINPPYYRSGWDWGFLIEWIFLSFLAVIAWGLGSLGKKLLK